MIEGIAFVLVSCLLAIVSARRTVLGWLSITSVASITGLLYYVIIPVLARVSGRTEFLGMSIPEFGDTGSLYAVALLYVCGAAVGAMWGGDANRGIAPNLMNVGARVGPEYYVLLSASLIVIAYLVATGQLALFGGELSWSLKDDGLLFLTQAYNILVVLTVVYFVKRKGDYRGIVVVVAVIGLLVVVGFRFRLVLLCVGVLACLVLIKRWRLPLALIVLAAVAGVAALNVFGAIRRYGRGLDVGGVQSGEVDLLSAAADPGGEIGPFLVAYRAASASTYDGTIGVDPWLIGLARLVPSALWPQKPSAYYLVYSWDGFNYYEVANSGIAPPQLAEFLWQFGWWGIAPLSVIAFSFASRLLSWMRRWESVYGVAGVSLVPGFFGFYMQSRGYFSQIMTDGLVMFGCLALLQLAEHQRRGASRRLTSRRVPM